MICLPRLKLTQWSSVTLFFSEKKMLLPLQSALGLIYSKTEDNTAIIDIDSSDVGGAGRSTKVKVH